MECSAPNIQYSKVFKKFFANLSITIPTFIL